MWSSHMAENVAEAIWRKMNYSIKGQETEYPKESKSCLLKFQILFLEICIFTFVLVLTDEQTKPELFQFLKTLIIELSV